MAEEKKITDTQKDETIKDGVYQVKSSRGGTFKVMSQDEKSYQKDMEAGLAHKPSDRPKYLKQLSTEEQKLVQAANEQGKGVRWTDKNGDHVFTFVPSKEQKEKAAAKEKAEKEAAQGEKKEGSSWWKWLLGGLAVVGLGVGAYFLFRKKDKSNTTSSTNNTTNTTTNTDSNTTSNTTTNTNTNTNTSTNISAPAINTGSSLTDTIASNSGGTVDIGYTPEIGITGLGRGGRD